MLHASGLTQVVGTPSYMAPEQATGIGVDTRADVHALAAVAYQMLTGHLVRTGTVHELVAAGVPPAPSQYVDLPPAVDEVLLRGLQPAPDDRWDDVGSFTAALRAALPGADEQLTLWHVPESVARSGPASAPLWPIVLLSLVVFVAAIGAAYAVTSLV